jgi:hypothetical protein
VEAAAPDLITAVIGFRHWRLLGSELWSMRATERWEPGLHSAHCDDPGHDTPAPANGCTCGIYAWYEPPPRGASLTTTDLVAGAIAAWGQLELHAHGMRAQYATIVALALPWSRGSKRRRLVNAANYLGVVAVPARRLEPAAIEHGELIPRSMRPPDLEPNKRKAPGEPDPARLYAVADGYGERHRSRRPGARG